MVGPNPDYIPPKNVALPARKYRVKFLPQELEVEVDPAKIPYAHTGLPGSLLQTAIAHKVFLNHMCGGMCSCTTCHLVVREGIESCSPQQEAEVLLLQDVANFEANSRLACQCVPDGTRDLVVEVPSWNPTLPEVL
ncbi:MAG: 2Fe-2S iron-sulfur cluster binding domain-containing protein [Planctomycetes bacterium]|nr:2Fe-2S iron-sulfur cluster binding domain-containing protein [Planctomycetota bacterium]